MKAKASKRSQRAVTLVEVLFVIGTIATLLLVVLPALQNSRRRSSPVNCVNHLKQVSLGFKMWAIDNNDRFPMQVSTNQGGSMEWIGTKEVYRHFLSASNEMSSPKVLVCPADGQRRHATTFAELKNQHISYFLNLFAIETNDYQHLLGGDRNLTRDGIQYPVGSYLIPTQQVLNWSEKLHNKGGNLMLSDGSVQQTSNQRLHSLISQLGPSTNWLAFP